MASGLFVPHLDSPWDCAPLLHRQRELDKGVDLHAWSGAPGRCPVMTPVTVRELDH